MTEKLRTGQCLCGGVAYEIHGPARLVVQCFCEPCRRTSGNFVAASNCAKSQLRFISRETLRWYQSSRWLKRGFCSCCGGHIVVDIIGTDYYSICAGSLDQPSGLKTIATLYASEQCDYLAFAEDHQSFETGMAYDHNWARINQNRN